MGKDKFAAFIKEYRNDCVDTGEEMTVLNLKMKM